MSIAAAGLERTPTGVSVPQFSLSSPTIIPFPVVRRFLKSLFFGVPVFITIFFRAATKMW
jgi:hypothetical protein